MPRLLESSVKYTQLWGRVWVSTWSLVSRTDMTSLCRSSKYICIVDESRAIFSSNIFNATYLNMGVTVFTGVSLTHAMDKKLMSAEVVFSMLLRFLCLLSIRFKAWFLFSAATASLRSMVVMRVSKWPSQRQVIEYLDYCRNVAALGIWPFRNNYQSVYP